MSDDFHGKPGMNDLVNEVNCSLGEVDVFVVLLEIREKKYVEVHVRVLVYNESASQNERGKSLPYFFLPCLFISSKARSHMQSKATYLRGGINHP